MKFQEKKNMSKIPEYTTYCLLYATAILCNKYVLSALGFQYPTIFQSWQALVSVFLIQMISGNPLKTLKVNEVLTWSPAMLLYVGSIYSGSIALSRLSVPVFVMSHAASDVILILCDDHLPTGAIHMSMPLKLSGFMLALWESHHTVSMYDIYWVFVHSVLSGCYRSVSYWYTSSNWPHSDLSSIQRQYLNNLLGFTLLFPTAWLLGHHQIVQHEFVHLGKLEFYIGCICSGILGFSVNKIWSNLRFVSYNASAQMVQLSGKLLTMLLSMHLYPLDHTLILWVSILSVTAGDVLHIVGSMVIQQTDLSHDISDVLVG